MATVIEKTLPEPALQQETTVKEAIEWAEKPRSFGDRIMLWLLLGFFVLLAMILLSEMFCSALGIRV